MGKEEALIPSLEQKGFVPFLKVSEWYFDRLGTLEKYRRHAYAMSYTAYEGVHLCFLHVFEWRLLEEKHSKAVQAEFRDATCQERPDTVLPYLATSRDGIHLNFQWIYGNQTLPLGGNFNASFIQPAAQVITLGGYHWIFYTANPHIHIQRWSGHEAIHLARYRQDRISGLSAAKESAVGTITTKPFKWRMDTAFLILNA